MWPLNLPDLNPVDFIACRSVAREDVQNTHLNELKQRLRKEWVGQDGSCRHCGSHLSVASLIRSVMRVLYTVYRHFGSKTLRRQDISAAEEYCNPVQRLLYYFPHVVISCIQVWRIRMPQLRWDTFWSFFL